MKRNLLRMLFCIFLTLTLTSCSSQGFKFVSPTSEKLREFVTVADGPLFVGSKMEKLDSYVKVSGKDGLGEQVYKQKQGFFDIGVSKNGIITSIRTASSGVLLSGKLYCGQTLEEVEEALQEYTKIKVTQDYYMFHDEQEKLGVEVRLDKDGLVSVIRISSVTLS